MSSKTNNLRNQLIEILAILAAFASIVSFLGQFDFVSFLRPLAIRVSVPLWIILVLVSLILVLIRLIPRNAFRIAAKGLWSSSGEVNTMNGKAGHGEAHEK